MHELALMGDILSLVRRDARKRNFSTIERIEVVVGELSNVLPGALDMAFEIYKRRGEEMLDPEAELVIVREEARARCTVCGREYAPERLIALCPHCNMPSGMIVSGETFCVRSYEGR
ncbi:hydrogenase nickel incorporation protein HypA/HybF [Planifilum fulgidum]|jgi:hydrogenase nickel incorporation protein HypA/HybF|uniref:Hydrogenase maturation factor HypA n=1 Tax=Planifilum fulgidum TaxID=201973 RepID=A0A1I2Q1M2_9BACL|nr:hydrogenase maturation nickel metallochaperone HypA [Planifilum fulgidum]MBO2533038.1 hydrogenase nickel incorporation protein HypA [Thermoactinomycetaceae bacterium]SFG22395.1 hydrogenase nickel incorporation protein HypA/HybF [Planifilum fulgidum]